MGYRAKKNAEGKTNPKLVERGKEAFAFVQGTGLELIIDYYQLDYNPDEIRDQFFNLFKVSS